MAVTSLIALSLTFTSGVVAQDAAGKVTYVSSGIAAGKALKELSAKVGLTLLASPTTENEILVISLKDAPVQEVMAKLAWAVGGSWKKEGDAYRLARTSEDNAAERARERNNIIAGYEKVLAKRKADLAKVGEMTATRADEIAREAAIRVKGFNPESRGNEQFWDFSTKLANESPAGRAVAKLTTLLTAAELADLPKGIRVVYSNQPTRAQRSLGSAAAAIAAAFQRDQSIWIEAMARHRVQNPTIGNMTYSILPDLMGTDDAQAAPTDKKVGKVLLAMTRSSYPGGGVQMELLLADTKGTIISRGNGQIWPTALAWENPVPAPPKDDPKVQRGADLETIASGVNRYGYSENLPEELRKRLMQPESYEPLGILVGQTTLNAAKATQVNLIAAVSDSMAANGTGVKELGYSLWRRSQEMSSEIVEEKGWLTMRPFAAVSARELFVDRKTLGQYLRRKAAPGRMKVEEAAMWAAKLPLEQEAPLANLLANYVASSGGQDRYSAGDGRILRFFGSLTPPQRAAARQGGLPLSRLEPHQLALVQQMVYGEYANLMPDHQKAEEMKIDVNNFFNGLLREPTESLPNGIPPDGQLQITETTSEVAFTLDSQGDGYLRPSQGMDASQIAWQQFAETRLDLFPWMKEPYQKMDLTRLRMGKRTSYNINLKFTPILSLISGLEDRDYATAEPIAFNALPAAFRQEVAKQIEALRKSHANMQPGNTTPATHSTPPPR